MHYHFLVTSWVSLSILPWGVLEHTGITLIALEMAQALSKMSVQGIEVGEVALREHNFEAQ